MLEIISLLENAKTREEKIEILRRLFQEIHDLAILPPLEQEHYAAMALEKVGGELTLKAIPQIFFELGKLCRNSTPRPAGW